MFDSGQINHSDIPVSTNIARLSNCVKLDYIDVLSFFSRNYHVKENLFYEGRLESTTHVLK